MLALELRAGPIAPAPAAPEPALVAIVGVFGSFEVAFEGEEVGVAGGR